TNLVPGDRDMFLDVFIRANVPVGPTVPTPTSTPNGGGGTPTNTPKGGTPTVTNTGGATATVTATPTQMIPCHQDTDCPLGQVCGSEGVCVPAPTPTPTIACTDTQDCPPGLVCVQGSCRDLSTPTVTPTPLPTCTTDQDCPDDTVCRANV